MSTEAKTYNGWTNRETWSAAIMLGQDRGSRDLMRKWAREAFRDATSDETFTREELATFGLADRIKDMHEENSPLAEDATIYSDLLSAALSEVNWQEIAEHYIDDIKDDILAEERDAEIEEQEEESDD